MLIIRVLGSGSASWGSPVRRGHRFRRICSNAISRHGELFRGVDALPRGTATAVITGAITDYGVDHVAWPITATSTRSCYRRALSRSTSPAQ